MKLKAKAVSGTWEDLRQIDVAEPNQRRKGIWAKRQELPKWDLNVEKGEGFYKKRDKNAVIDGMKEYW